MRGRRRIGVDSEGYLIGKANKTPKTVCVTVCCDDGEAEIFKWSEARDLLFDILNTPSLELILHHARFDLASFAAMDPELLALVFKAYDEDRIRCTMIREKLLALAKGELADEGDTGAKRNRKFSLAAIVLERFHVDLSGDKSSAKENKDGTYTLSGNKASWRLRYSELDNVPLRDWPEDAKKYALDDPRWNLAVYESQEAELIAGGGSELDGVIPDEMYQTRAAFWLYLMSAWGIRTDPVAVNALSSKLEAEWARINTVVRAGDVLKPQMKKGEMVWTKNMTAIRERVVSAFGGLENLPLSAWTPGGKDGKGKKEVSTSGETLLACVNRPCLDWIEERERAVVELRVKEALPPLSEEALTSLAKTLCHSAADEFYPPEETYVDTQGGAPPPRERRVESRSAVADRIFNQIILDALSERGNTEKLLKTYVPMLFDGTQRPICANTNELVATGRTSSWDPNLQNPPRKGGVRECFVPRRGKLFAFCDYSFIELVTLAQVCLWKFGYSVLGDSINAGRDPHLVMAAAMLGITYEEIHARRKEPLIKAARQGAKAINFGRPGGLGDDKFVEYAYATYGVRMTKTEARRYKELWFETYPEMREYLAFFGKMSLGDREFTITQLPSGRVRGGCRYTSGANCVDYETEALTKRGWVNGHDIRMTDEILTKNADTGALEWHTPNALNMFPDYVGPLVEFSSTRFSSVTTPEHRWLVKDHRSARGHIVDRCVTSAKLSRNGDHRIHRTGRFEGDDDRRYSDDVLELIGWFLTDGSLSRETGSTRISIYQTKEQNVPKINALFERLNIGVKVKTRRQPNGKTGVVWSFSNSPHTLSGVSKKAKTSQRGLGSRSELTFSDYVDAGIGVDPDPVVAVRLGVTTPAVRSRRARHDIPRPGCDGKGVAALLRSLFPDRLLTPAFVSSLSRRQAAILLNTMMLGDGTGGGDTGLSAVFCTRSEESARAVQMLAVLVGMASKAEWRDMSVYAPRQKTYPSMANKPKMSGIWAVILYKRDTAQIQRHQVREFSESRGVWCPTVPNGYFVARRRGTVYITGNSMFQGLAADGIKRAGWNVSKECYLSDPYFDDVGPTALFGSRIVAMLHDELILEVPEEKAHEATERLSERMISGMHEVVPDIKVGTEAALARRWYKGAEPVFVDGRLVPWAPKEAVVVEKEVSTEALSWAREYIGMDT